MPERFLQYYQETFPNPLYPMKEGERSIFIAEQAVFTNLIPLLHEEFPESVKLSHQLIADRIVDLSTTAMADICSRAYGLTGNPCESDKQIQQAIGLNYHAVNNARHTAIQSIILFYKDKLALNDTTIQQLQNRYVGIGSTTEPINEVQQRIYKRAEANVRYYQDRLFLIQMEEDLLPFLSGLYGQNTADRFAKYYRLGSYKDKPQFERRGCWNIDFHNTAEILQAVDACEAGRATAEYLTTEATGNRLWVNIKGKEIQGYRRKGSYFESVLSEYRRQEQIAQALKDGAVELEPAEKELLELTTEAKLSGNPKQNGEDIFYERHSGIKRIQIDDLEKKVLNQLQIERLVTLNRAKRIAQLLASPNLSAQFSQKLAEVLYNYHIEGMTRSQIADELYIPIDALHSLKALLERTRLRSLGLSTNTLPMRGEVSRDDINAFFTDDKIPESILDILKQFTTPVQIKTVLADLNLGFKIYPYSIATLLRLAEDIVREDEQERIQLVT